MCETTTQSTLARLVNLLVVFKNSSSNVDRHINCPSFDLSWFLSAHSETNSNFLSNLSPINHFMFQNYNSDLLKIIAE